MNNLHLPLISRVLIALLFVVAGIPKLMDFQAATGMMPEALPMPAIVAALVILIEIPVALLYAWGYKVRWTGGLLALYTLLTIVFVHNNFSSMMAAIPALKNLAIIGGILATTGACSCNRCAVLNPKNA